MPIRARSFPRSFRFLSLQLTSNFAAENCLEGQPLSVHGQDPGTSLMLMTTSSNSIRDLFTLQNSVSVGSLYRGFSASEALLVRQLPPQKKEDRKGKKKDAPRSFLAAVGAMHRAEHPNLARVRAYSRSKNRSSFVVWEGFGNTIPLTMRAALEGGGATRQQDTSVAFLDWAARWRVMTQVASALQYLHEEQRPTHPHGFLTSSRVILGKGGKPFLTDFCLCRHLEKPASITDDVYNFGVLLFELIRGQPLGKGEAPEQLVKKAVSLLTAGHVAELLDARLGGRFKEAELSGAVAAAAMCMQADALERPKMSLIVQTFNRSEALAQEMEDPFAFSLRKPSFNEGQVQVSMTNFLDDNLVECDVPEWASHGRGDVEMTARGGYLNTGANKGLEGQQNEGFERPPMTMQGASSIWGDSTEAFPIGTLNQGQNGSPVPGPPVEGDRSQGAKEPGMPLWGGRVQDQEGFERPPMTMQGAGSIWGGSSEESSSKEVEKRGQNKGSDQVPPGGGGLKGGVQGQGAHLWQERGLDENASDKYRSWMMGGELQMHPEHIKLGALLGQVGCFLNGLHDRNDRNEKPRFRLNPPMHSLLNEDRC
jgi:hypothetical protein